jgi:hypothetical protein
MSSLDNFTAGRRTREQTLLGHDIIDPEVSSAMDVFAKQRFRWATR